MILTTDLTVNKVLNELMHGQKIELVKNLLTQTNREGMQNIIEFLAGTDFYTAPSSASYHSNYKGGLLDHSLLVCALALKYRQALIEMKPELATQLSEESVVISALLHDVCKCGFYKQKEKWKKDDAGAWKSYIGYEIDDSFPIGHGEKSVIMLLHLGLKLTPEEMLAIRFHMGSWDGALLTNDVKYSYQTAMNMCPLMTLLQMADNTSSLLFEKNETYYTGQ